MREWLLLLQQVEFDLLGTVFVGLDMQDDALLAFEPFGERREVERNVIAVGIALRVAAGVVAQLQLQVIRFGRFGL